MVTEIIDRIKLNEYTGRPLQFLKQTTMNYPNEDILRASGFDFVKTYNHDEWYTNRYKKGVIQAEFTYKQETYELETFDITIYETFISPTKNELEVLDTILNKQTIKN